jgi:20S proteasome alpha/beta subunit
MDGIGAQTVSTEFVAAGTASAALLSTCEAMHVPNSDPATVLGLTQKIIQKSLQRDVLSGCNIFSYTMHNSSIYRKLMTLPDV